VQDQGLSLGTRSALIVGGSGGVGAAVSIVLARAGASVTIHGGHSEDRLRRTASRIRETGTLVEAFLQELISASDAETLLDRTGIPDLLVIAFGPYQTGSLGATPDHVFRRMTELNLLFPAALIRRALASMREREWGRIIVFGGPRADRVTGFRTIAAYAAAKSGLASLVRSVALETAGTDVTCNMISPGYVETEYYSEDQIDRLRSRLPGGVLVQPEQIADLVSLLASEPGAAINGAIIPVDFGS